MINQDSSQSLSDEDELEGEVSLCCNTSKRGLPVMFQLDLLKGNDHYTTAYQEDVYGNQLSHVSRKTFNREVKDCIQAARRDHTDSGDESISDEEKTLLSRLSATSRHAHFPKSERCDYDAEYQNGACAWSSVLEDAKNLDYLQSKSRMHSTSKYRNSGKAHGGRVQLASLMRDQLLKATSCRLPAVMNEAETSSARDENAGSRFKGISMDESFVDLEEDFEEAHEMPVVFYEKVEALPSVTEMLDNLQGKTTAANLIIQNAKRKQKKTRASRKQTSSSVGTRELDDDDMPDFVESEESSGDEGLHRYCIKSSTSKPTQQTMADLFQKNYSTSEINEPRYSAKQPGTDYYERLQQVMQTEKERHLEFSKQLQQCQSSPFGSRCIDVQILSRVLEAKLTVCRCLFSKKTERSTHNDAGGRSSDVTVIFSSKISDTVDLEVGNLVRIHPPWREVCLSAAEKIILCTYFTQAESETSTYI